MGRIGITYQDVATAAATVQGHDQIPTVDRVREILRTGSKSTIARYLKEWKAKTKYIQGTDGVPEELIAIVKGLWDRLKNEADQSITNHQQEADRSIAEIRQSYITEQKRSAELQACIRQLEEKLHAQTKLTNELQLILEEEKRSTVKLTERNSVSSQQLNDQKTEIDCLHKLLSHVQANLEHYQTSMQKLREEQSLTADKQKIAYEREIESLKQKSSEAMSQRNHLHREFDQLKTELKLLTKQHDVILEEKNLAYTQLQEKVINEAALQSRCEQLNAAYNDFQNKIEQKSETVNSHEKKMAVLIDQITRLNKSLEDAHDTIRVLRDEKLFLAQEKAHLEGQFKQLQA